MPHSPTVVSRHPIRRLPPQLANQIAAGEVVERPASIIKELLENSLDAGAGRIRIDLERGGLQAIRVQDDGHGIPAGELRLALSAHATSKIHHSADLAAIRSMGFRGEALASIASVSRLSLTSRSSGADSGWTVQASQAEPEHPPPRPASHPVGTTVQVSELFFNTPARRRFLRSERTEYRHCEDVVRRLALANPAVAWDLQHNGRPVFNLPAARDAAGRQRRLARLAGRAFSEAALELEFEHAGLRLHGWVAPSSAARSRPDVQYVFVNGRIIRDRLISHAIRQAYENRLAPDRHPAYVLYLELDPARVDVNVHPAKSEVRFQESRRVHDFLGRCLREALAQEMSGPGLPYARESLDWHVPATGTAPVASSSVRVAEGNRPYSAVPPATVPAGAKRTFLSILPGDAHALWEQQGELWLVDIRRLIATALRSRFVDTTVAPRPLLMPLALNVGESTARQVAAMQAQLAAHGLDLDQAGPGSLLLRGVPPLPVGVDVEVLFQDVLTRTISDPDPGEQDASVLATAVLEAIAARAATCMDEAGWSTDRLAPWLAELAELAEKGDLPAHPALRRFDPAGMFGRR